jgi:nucleotide-binding universal stress UspA family protein
MTYRIVVGVDGSEHSTAALRWALDEAQARSGEVTALFSWQMPFLSFPGAFDRDELDKASKEFLIETVSKAVPTPPVPLRTVVAEVTRPRRWSPRRRTPTCWCSVSGAGRRSPACCSAR